MKNKLNVKILIFFCLLTGNYSIAYSQKTEILENFSVFYHSGSVNLSWTIISGSTCNGIQIYRAGGDHNFKKIGEIAGICGSSSSPEFYDFIDENPIRNDFNFYKLELGGSGLSDEISIEIIELSTNGYQIRPNPVVTSSKLYFSNDKKAKHFLRIYDYKGFNSITLNSYEDFFTIDAGLLETGFYIFSILKENGTLKATGKLIIQ